MNNIFTFRKGSLDAPEQSWKGIAWVVNKGTNAGWKVQFLCPLRTTYLVLELDPDHRWAVVGTPNRKLVWVLARDRALSDETYAMIMKRMTAQGYDAQKMVKVPQP